MKSLDTRMIATTGLLLSLVAGGCAGDGQRGSSRQHLRAALSADSLAELTGGDTLNVSPATRRFYEGRRYRPAWLEDGELTEQGEALYVALGRTWMDGLPTEHYRFDAVQSVRQRLAAAEAGDDSLKAQVPALLGDLDLLLTEGITRYSDHLAQGALDPKASGVDWRIPREHAPESSILDALVKGRSVDEVVTNLRPKAEQYERFMQALVRYRELERRGLQWPQLPADAQLAPGDSGQAVVLLRQRLSASPDPREAQLASRGTVPNVYDEQLAAAVKHFQERHAIEPDGALGPATITELNRTLAERLDELRLNMDRWRWLPHDLGARYVLVNVAGFELEVVENGKVIETMNVVVGQEGWHTPIFADTMEYIVVNPSWNVPQSILEDEILPAIQRDPDYLARNNMEMDENGRVRQLPGDDNALGRLKFMFPNDDNIYLHDTPAKSLFSRTRRDYSHGCIRLERPEDLARLILSRTTKDRGAQLEQLLANDEEKWLKFDEQLPVYILYFTAWVQEDGTVRFHHDVYGRDRQLERQQDKTLAARERVGAGERSRMREG
jgi:murein L,D-transpeptidase YcbB/YkuD